jgi:choline-sulfatase
MNDRPNIVICMCDQLRSFEVGCYGNPVARTPHIDRLAAEGVRFDLAVSNNPICMPARSCMLSGLHSRSCMGIVDNYTADNSGGAEDLPDLPAATRDHFPGPTLPEQLKKAGYETALIGKWHVHPAPWLVGFDYSLFPRVHHRHTGQEFFENDGPGRVVDGFSVEYEADQVQHYLSRRDGRPFFLFYNISPPHMPLMDAPEKYLTMFSPDEIPLRLNTEVDGRLAYDEEWFKIYLWDFLYYQEKLPHTRDLPVGMDLRSLTALYYGLTSWVDDSVGRLMSGLDAHGLREDTIVVFLSDHGDNLGSHGLFNKGRLIEESIRIPLIFSAPDRWKRLANREQVAQIIDVMPTLLDACGGDIPPGVGGRSLLPILEGDCAALGENGAFIETRGGQIGIRTPTHMYGAQLSADLRGVADDRLCFFDLRDDPYQLDNLTKTDRQGHEADSLRRRLLDWHDKTPWLE